MRASPLIELMICSVKRLMFEASAFESLNGGQFTSSTQLINLNFHFEICALVRMIARLTPIPFRVGINT